MSHKFSDRSIWLSVLLFIFCFLTLLNKVTYSIAGASVGNLIVALFACVFVIFFIKNKEGFSFRLISLFKLTWLVIVLLAFIKMIFAFEIFGRALSSYVRLVLIPTVIFLPIYLKLSTQEISKSFSKIYIFTAVISIIALVQVAFRDYLPEFLLNYKVQGERIDDYVFADLIVMRANGLFGNPLELASFLVFMSAPAIIYNLNSKMVYALLLLMAVISTLSRAAMVGFIFLVLVGVLFGNYTNRTKIFVLLFIVCVSLFASYFDFVQLAAVVDRLTGASSESAESSLTRLVYLNEAIKIISGFPEIITGINLGTYTSGSEEISSSIQDGYFLNYAVDYGPLLFIFLLFSNFYLFLLGCKFTFSRRSRSEGILIISLVCLWLFFCIVNSALLHTSVSFAYYFLIGLAIRLAIINRQKI